PRMLFRSRHIYILLAALLNIGLGAYFKIQIEGWERTTQIFGSIAIVTATILIIAAFFYEPIHADLQNTPFSQWGLYLIAAGTIAHAIAGAAASPVKT